jgi:hypothetical protein
MNFSGTSPVPSLLSRRPAAAAGRGAPSAIPCTSIRSALICLVFLLFSDLIPSIFNVCNICGVMGDRGSLLVGMRVFVLTEEEGD